MIPGRKMQRLRGGLVFKDHRPCVSLNSRLEGNKEEDLLDGVAGASLALPLVRPSLHVVQPLRDHGDAVRYQEAGVEAHPELVQGLGFRV